MNLACGILGEVLEWLNRRAWKARVPGNRDRGFESRPLRFQVEEFGISISNDTLLLILGQFRVLKMSISGRIQQIIHA